MPRPFGDVLVVLPGIMGSTLLDRHGHEVWGQEAALLHGVALGGIGKLRLEEGIGDEHPGDGVTPGKLMPGVFAALGAWSTSLGYGRLLEHLRRRYDLAELDPAHPERPANFVPFAYDWRLSNRYNGRRLGREIGPVLARWREATGNPAARLVFVCHSMGGLVARWYVDREGGHADTRAVITIGTPHRGSVMAVDRLANGVRWKAGPIGLDLTGLARSLPSLHQLLPAYACVDDGKAMHTLTEWAGLPADLDGPAAHARAFYDELGPPAGSGLVRPIVGTDNPTMASVRFNGGGVELLRTMRLPDGTTDERAGDGTVPRFAAYPAGFTDQDPRLHFVRQTHGGLPGHEATLEQLTGVLDGSPIEFRSLAARFGIDVDEVAAAGKPLLVRAESEDDRAVLQATIAPADGAGAGRQAGRSVLTNLGGGRYETSFTDLPPGGYEVRVGRAYGPGPLIDAVVAATVVADPEAGAQ
ncbi:MAG TPA: hypothetical protein VL738_37620 [Dactylosporangium sp.]|nr:hypothetical protein [Dactylosporangium sp.]